MVDFRESFTPENIEHTAQSLSEAIPYMRDWTGCTRLDVATEIGVPVSLLEKAMEISDQLTDRITMIEEKSLSEDLVRLKSQITDKHTNAQLVKQYYEQKYGRTTRVIENSKGLEDKPVVPVIRLVNSGKDGSEHEDKK